MPWASSCRAFATDAASVVVVSMLGRSVGWCPYTTPRRSAWNRFSKAWRLGARCCFDSWAWDSISVSSSSRWRYVSELGEWGEREGERGKEGRQGGVVSRARLSRVCPSRLMEEGGRCQLSCKLREVLLPIQR